MAKKKRKKTKKRRWRSKTVRLTRRGVDVEARIQVKPHKTKKRRKRRKKGGKK